MKHLLYLAALLLTTVACTQDEITETKATALVFNLSAEDCPVTLTRSTAIPNVDAFTVKVGEKTYTYAELKQESPLYLEAKAEGSVYTVEAYSNEMSNKPILGKPCFYAKQEVTLFPDQTKSVEMTCKLQQIMVSFKYSEEFKKAFKEEGFKLTVSNDRGESLGVDFKDLNESVYFAPGDQGSDYMKINVKATTQKGFPVDFTETIQKNDKSTLVAKDHIILNLNVSETKTMSLKTEIQ